MRLDNEIYFGSLDKQPLLSQFQEHGLINCCFIIFLIKKEKEKKDLELIELATRLDIFVAETAKLATL